MADIGEIILKLMVDNTDLKAKLDQAQDRIGSFEKTSTAKFGNIGNMFLKMFGAGLLVRQLGIMIAQMDEVNAALAKMKAQTQGMFEDVIRPAIPYIVGGLETISRVLRGALAVFNLYGAALGSFYGAIYSVFKGGNIKDTIGNFVAQMKDAWKQTEEIFNKSEQTKAANVVKPIIKNTADGDKDYRKALDKFYKPYEDLRQDRMRKMKEEHDAEIKAAADAAAAKRKIYEEMYNRIDERVNGFVDTTARALNGEKDAWKNWADSIIQEIERVLLKKLLLAGLDWLTGGPGFIGTITNALMSKSSPNVNLVIHNLPPGAFAEVITGSMNQAPQGTQARLARVVNRGKAYEVRR